MCNINEKGELVALQLGYGDISHRMREACNSNGIVSFSGIIIKDDYNSGNVGKKIVDVYPEIKRSEVNIDW